MEEINGKCTLLYNIAPNGLKVDRVYITEVPNCDNSGVEYFIEYLDDFNDDSRISIGHCNLTMGTICFDNVGEMAKTIGIESSAMKLVIEWIERNKE